MCIVWHLVVTFALFNAWLYMPWMAWRPKWEQEIEGLRKIASKKGIGYLTLIRIWVTERFFKEIRLSFIHRLLQHTYL